MLTFLGRLHPRSKFGKRVLGVEVRFFIHDVVVCIGEQLRDLLVCLTTTVNRTESRGQDGHLLNSLSLAESNELFTEFLLRGSTSAKSEEYFRRFLGVLPELSRHRDLSHAGARESEGIVDNHR